MFIVAKTFEVYFLKKKINIQVQKTFSKIKKLENGCFSKTLLVQK